MNMTRVRGLGIALVGTALILAACDGSEASDGPTSTPATSATGAPGATHDTSDRPPAAIASIDGEAYDLALGTYCWGGLCADAIGVITPPEQVAVSAGDALDLGGDITGIDLTERVWVIYAVSEPVGSGEGWVAFRPEGDGMEIPTGDDAAIPGDLAAGDYVLTLTVRQEGQDAFYGLWISVD